MLMNQLRTRNPQGYEFIRKMQASGQDPKTYIIQSYKNGTLSKAQFETAVRQARMFGVKINDAQIAEIEKSGQSAQAPTPQGGGNEGAIGRVPSEPIRQAGDQQSRDVP